MKPKFELFDRVWYDGQPRYISGVRARIPYSGEIDWLYNLTCGTYNHDYDPTYWGGRCDFNTVESIPECKIFTIEEYSTKRKEELKEELNTLEQLIKEKKNEQTD